MDIDANKMIAELTAQRNDAMDQVAMLRAAVSQLNDELADKEENRSGGG